MPVKTKMPYDYGLYFITYTCFHWLSLISITNSYDLIYKGFDYLKGTGHYINGYVIMPNHIHVLIAFRNKEKNLNKLIGDCKRFVGYGMVKRLQADQKKEILQKLSDGVLPSHRKRGKLHEVWEHSFDWKICDSFSMIEQKLNYIHDNPCIGKWNLAESPVDYIHSSAHYYITGEQGIYSVTNYMELEDIDLSRPSG